jgi:hypothetical protein
MATSSDMVNYQNPFGSILTSLLGGQENTDVTKNTTGTQTLKTTADLASLRDVYAKQAAGITPEMMTALFAEGSKKVPTLTNAYANAVGARSGNNSPLGLSIHDLQAQLTNDAARLNMQMLSDSGKTAAQIADLSKSSTTTNTGSDSTSIDSKKTVDKDALKLLGGLGIGTSVLDGLLGGNGVTGGVNDLFKLITGSGGSWLKDFFGSGTGSGSGPDFGDFTDWTDDSWLDGAFDDFDFNMDWLTDGLDFSSGAGDASDWFSGVTDLFGWADGGLVTKKKGYADGGSTTTGAGNQQQMMQRFQQLMVMARLKKMASTPAGKKALIAYFKKKQGAGGTPNGPTPDSPGAGTGQATGIAGNVGSVQGNSISSGMVNSALGMLGMALGIPGLSTIGNVTGISQGIANAATGNVAAANQASVAAAMGLTPAEAATPEGIAAAAAAVDSAPNIGEPGSLGIGSNGADGTGVGGGPAGTGGDGPGGDYADGGEVDDDEEGIEDDIPIMVSQGEYVIPADVVRRKGTDFFDKLIEQQHTPAAMQRAMGA